MARLPTPGGDVGNWGAILNDYLSQAHDATGQLKDTGILSIKYTKPPSGIPASDLEAGVQDILDTVADHTTELAQHATTLSDHTTSLAEHNTDLIAKASHSDLAAVTTRVDGSLKADGTLKDMVVARRSLDASVVAAVNRGITLGNRVGSIGDSHMQAGTSYTDKTPSPLSWVWLAGLLSKQRIHVTHNAGIGGQKLFEMLARFDTDILAYDVDTVLIGGGTNDITYRTIADMRADLIAMIEKSLGAGRLPVIQTIPSRDDADYKLKIQQWNMQVRILADRYGIPLIDMWTATANPATGAWKSGYVQGDNIHPTAQGAMAMAQAAVDVLSPVLAPYKPRYASLTTDPLNMLANGAFIGDSNSDGVADTWGFDAPGSVVTYSLVPNDDGGNWQRLVYAQSGYKSLYSFMNLATGKWAVGDVLRFSGQFRASVTSIQPTIGMVCSGGGPEGEYRPVNALTISLDGAFDQLITVPSGTTSVGVSIFSGGGSVGTLDVGNLSLVNLTKHGLA